MPERGRHYKRKLYFSTRDRILLHLLDFVGYEGEFNVPDEVTQFGIAEAIGLGRSTVSKAIRRMIKLGLVKGARAHVPSGKLRRTVYLLTETGVDAANRRRREIEEDIILFRDGEGVERRLRVGQLPRLVPEYATLLDVAAHVAYGAFDASAFRGRRIGKFVDLTDRLPRLRYFFGREEELAAMDAWLASPTERVLVISGITGIGKTTLLARKLEDWKGERHLLFQRLMEWTTVRNVAQQLAEFLTRLGKKELAQYLESRPVIDIEDVVSIVVSGLASTPAVLVYDDYHSAEEPIRNLFYSLRAAIESTDGLRLLVAGRKVTPFYDRRDVRVRGTVRELALEGLDPKSAGRILQVRNVVLPPQQIELLYRQTAGHPLFLELVDSASVSDAQDIHRYLQEELFARITDAEAMVLTVASVFRYPVHADALFVDETVTAATVRGLVEQSLLREVSVKVYEVHDVVRSFFGEMMTPQDRKRFHRWAAQFRMGGPEPDPLEALYHFVEAGETTNAARLAVKERKALLKGNRSDEVLRVLERLLPSVEDAGHSAELRLLKARILDRRGELDQAVVLYGEIVQLDGGGVPQPRTAEAHRYLGDILRRQDRSSEAENHFDAALRLYRSLDHGEGQAETLLAMGVLAEYRSDFQRAERLYERAIALARRLDLRGLEAEARFAFSRLLGARGDLSGALEWKQQALAIAEGLGDWYLQARFQVSLGANLQELERYEESLKAYEQGVETARRIGDLRMLGYGLWNAAGGYMRHGDLMRAETCLKEAEGLFRKLREPVMEALVLGSFGWLWEKRGKWGLAKQRLRNELEILRHGGHSLDLARQSVSAAHLFHRNGETAEALTLLEEGLAIARRLRASRITDEAQRYLTEYSRTSKESRDPTPGPDAVPTP